MTQAFAQTSGKKDVTGEIDVNPGAIFERIDAWVDGFIRLLPNIVTAIIVLTIFWAVAWLAKRAFNKWAKSIGRDNLGSVFGSFIRYLIIGLGFLLAATLIIPTLRPGDLIAGLGVGSVAIGFAFKDILQNWLAGMLLLFRQPFEVGDQIVAQGYEGTVERIETRATVIKTYDGRQVLIPNSEVYTNAVQVNTAFDVRRSQYDVGIGYNDSIDDGVKTMLKAVESIDGVLNDPAPEVIVSALGDWSVVLRARWWTKSQRTDVVHVQSEVMIAIKKALDGAGIDMPYETQVHLWHDQTEEFDGIRGKQREGWPTVPGVDDPKVRFGSQQNENKQRGARSKSAAPTKTAKRKSSNSV